MGKQQQEQITPRRSVYNDLGLEKQGVDYDKFSQMFDTNEDFRKSIYSDLGFESNGIDYEKFYTTMGKPQEVSPQGSVNTSPTSVEPIQNTNSLGQNIESPQSSIQDINATSLEQSLGSNRQPIDPLNVPQQPQQITNPNQIGKQFAGGMEVGNVAKENITIDDYGLAADGLQRVIVDIPYDDHSLGIEKQVEFVIPKGTQVISPRLASGSDGAYTLQYIDESGNRSNAIETLSLRPTALQNRKKQLEQKPFEEWTLEERLEYFGANVEEMTGKITDEEKRRREIISEATADREESKSPLSQAWDIASGAVRSFGSGATRLGADLLGIPRFLNDAIAGVMGTPTWDETYGKTIIEKTQDYMRGAIDRDDLYNSVRFNNKGVVDSFKDGDVSDGIAKLVMGTTNSLPIMLSLTSGNVGGLASTLSMGAGQYDELSDNKNMDQSAKMLNATLNMYAEMIPEKIGAEATFKPFYDLFRSQGKEVAESALRDYMRKFAGQFGVITPTLVEGTTEASTAVLQNMIAKYSGEDPERNIMDGVADAAAIGAFSGQVISTPAQIANSLIDKSKRKEVETLAEENSYFERALEDQDFSDNEREVMTSKYLANVDKINSYIEEQIEQKGRLTGKQKALVEDLESRKQRMSSILDNPNIPDSIKESTQSDIDAIDDQIQEVLVTTVEPDLSKKTPKEIDANVERQREAMPDLASAPMGEVEVGDEVFATLDKLGTSERVESTEIESAIESLYEKKKELKSLLKNPERLHTTSEINEAIAGVDADLESLNNYKGPKITEADFSVAKPGDSFAEGEVKSSRILDDGSIEITTTDNTVLNSKDYAKQTETETEIQSDIVQEGSVVPMESNVEQETVTTQEVVEPNVEINETEIETVVPEIGVQNQDVAIEPEQVTSSPEQFETELDYYKNLAETSTNPDDIAVAYNYLQPGEPGYIDGGIMEYISKINAKDIERWGDLKSLTRNKKARWVDKTNKSLPLDVAAQELSNQLGVEVTEQDFIDFIERYDGSADFNEQQKTDSQRLLEDKYKELTGRNLTPKVARRTANRIDRNMTDQQRLELSDVFSELGITYDDIINYENYIESTTRENAPGIPKSENDKSRSGKSNQGNTSAQKQEVNETKESSTKKNEPKKVRAKTEQKSSDTKRSEGSKKTSPNVESKSKSLKDVLRSQSSRAERLAELKERIAKNKPSSFLGITPNPRKEAEYWKDVTDYAIISLVDGVIATSRQLAEALGIPHNKKLIKAFSDAKRELFENKEEYGDYGITAAKNAENARRRAEFGFDERIKPAVRGFDQVEAEADRLIKDGYDINSLVDKALRFEPLTDTEVLILTRRSQELEKRLVDVNTQIEDSPNMNPTDMRYARDKRNAAVDEMYRVIKALENSGTVSARALNVRRALLARDMSLAGMFSEYREAVGNRELLDSEMKDITEKYNRIVAIKDELEARNAELEKENIRLDAEIEFARQKYEAELEYRKKRNKAAAKTEQVKDIQERRAVAKANLNEALRNVFADKVGFAATPEQQAKQMDDDNKKLSKALRELAKTYIDEALVRVGKVDFDNVIDKIHNDIKESIPNVTREQVMNFIDSSSDDNRPTRSDLNREVARFNNELKMLNEIARLEKGGLYTPKKQKEINDARLEYLRKNLRELRKRNMDPEVKTKADVDKAIKSLKDRISETRRKINNKEYATERKQLVLNDPAVKKLQKELNDVQFRFKVDVRKEEYRRRNIFLKASGFLREVVAVPRTLMATGDLSAPLRQTAFVVASRPLQIIPALGRMFQFYGSKQAYDDYFDAFKETEIHDVMVKSGVSLTDVVPNIGAAAREEQFMSSFVANMEKFVPGIGGGEFEYKGKKIKVPGLQLHGRAERGFTGYINKVRIDLFTHGAELLMREGKYPDTDLNDYKKLATYVNAVTGRGPMPEQWSGIMADLSSVFFAPRLMTSRLWLLAGGPIWKGNSVTRQMYLRDLVSFVAFGSLVMAASSLAGAEVIGDEEDEKLFGEGAADSWTNSDFGNIVVGDTRYDVWGGFGQYVRFISRMATGQKTSTTGKVTKLNSEEWNSETYADLLARFGRSKLSPVASLIVSAMVGKNYMGEPFSVTQELSNMASPLVWQDTYEAWTDQNQGVKSLFTIFAPSFFGLGVQTWEANSFLNKGADDKIAEMLADKKVATMTKDVTNIKFYDVDKGEERNPTPAELKKFTDIWSNYVKSDLNENYDKYKKMGEKEFEDKFVGIKSSATRYAKEQMSGISVYDQKIELNGVEYKLTPDQIKQRVKWNEEFVKEYSSDFKDYENDLIDDGVSPDQAKIQAQKRMESKARAYSKSMILEAVEDGRMTLEEK